MSVAKTSFSVALLKWFNGTRIYKQIYLQINTNISSRTLESKILFQNSSINSAFVC